MIVGIELHLPGRETPEKMQLEVLISGVSRLTREHPECVVCTRVEIFFREFSICFGYCNGISIMYLISLLS